MQRCSQEDKTEERQRSGEEAKPRGCSETKNRTRPWRNTQADEAEEKPSSGHGDEVLVKP